MTRKKSPVNTTETPVTRPDGRQRRWAGHREQRRDELIAAAMEAVRRHGADVGMDAIAASAGVSKPVLYRYFADRSDLWLAVSKQVAAGMVAAIAPAVDAVREDRAAIAAAIDTYLRIIAHEPELYRFVVHRPGITAERDLTGEIRETIAGGLARVIGDRLRAHGLDAGAAQPWAHGSVGYLQAVGDWWLRERQPISREALTEYVTMLLWNGVAGIRASADIPGGLEALDR